MAPKGRASRLGWGVALAVAALWAAPGDVRADLVRTDCGYVLSNGQVDSQDSRAGTVFASASCIGASYQLLATSSVGANTLGAAVVLNWTVQTRGGGDEYVGTAQAFLSDTLFAPGAGMATMTIDVPVHGLVAESGAFGFTVGAYIRLGGPEGTPVWSTMWDTSQEVDEVAHVTVDIELGQPVPFDTQLSIWGGNTRHPVGYAVAQADFSHTMTIAITGLTDAEGRDILGTLQAQVHPGMIAAPPAIPEPAAWHLAATGLGLLAWQLRRRRPPVVPLERR